MNRRRFPTLSSPAPPGRQRLVLTPGPTLRQVDQVYVEAGRRCLLYFGGCDYFRLANDPRLIAAAAAGLRPDGLNVAASRVTTGNHPLYAHAELGVAGYFGVERALLCPTGYTATLIAIEGWRDRFTHALVDERAHPCLVAGAQLTGRPLTRFRHGDVVSLRGALRGLGRTAQPLVATDGVFANDGFIAPLADYLDELPRRGWLLVDEAHAAGILGQRGRGTLEYAGLQDSRVLRTCTFSKAFGVYGGAVLGDAEAVTWIAGHSNTFAGSTPLPLPLVATVIESLRLLRSDTQRRRRLAAHTAWLKARLERGALPVSVGPAPIVSVARTGVAAADLRRRLLTAGIHPSFIRYPGVTAAGHFRFAISSEHEPAQLERLADVLIGQR